MAGNFDTIYSNIIAVLEAYSSASDEADQFTVYDNYMRAFPNDSSIANVFCYLGPMSPGEQGGNSYLSENWTYYFDLIAKKSGTLSGDDYTRADAAAGERLRYLVHQVKSALYTVDGWKFGMDAGKIGNKKMLSVDILGPDDPRMTEKVLAAARLTMTIETIFEPELLEGVTLDSIYTYDDADDPKWAVLVEPEEV